MTAPAWLSQQGETSFAATNYFPQYQPQDWNSWCPAAM